MDKTKKKSQQFKDSEIFESAAEAAEFDYQGKKTHIAQPLVMVPVIRGKAIRGYGLLNLRRLRKAGKMGANSKIEWTESTWNPVVGCSKVSSGCANCYAEKMAYRLACMGISKYSIVTQPNKIVRGGEWNGLIHYDSTDLETPLHWKKPRKIFVCSMGDLFHEDVPFDFIDKVFGVIALCPQHTFMLLTKRPERMEQYFEDRSFNDVLTNLMKEHGSERAWSKSWLNKLAGRYALTEKWALDGYESKLRLPESWPLPNVIGMTTVCNQEEADKNIPILLNCKFARRGISVEPMLEEIEIPFIGWEGLIRWVIVGCESGSHRRECKIEWVRSIVQQCQAASVPVFVKQLDIGGRLVKDVSQFPEDLKIREFPMESKK